MKKQIRQRMTSRESAAERKLALARETVRTLGEDELSRVVGGCITTSWTSDNLSGHS